MRFISSRKKKNQRILINLTQKINKISKRLLDSKNSREKKKKNLIIIFFF